MPCPTASSDKVMTSRGKPNDSTDFLTLRFDSEIWLWDFCDEVWNTKTRQYKNDAYLYTYDVWQIRFITFICRVSEI